MLKLLKNMSKKLKVNRLTESIPKKLNVEGMSNMEQLFIKTSAICGFVFSIMALFYALSSIASSNQIVKTNELLKLKLQSDSITIYQLKENLKTVKSKVSELENHIDSESERANKIVDRIDYIEGMTYEEHLYYIIKNKKKK